MQGFKQLFSSKYVDQGFKDFFETFRVLSIVPKILEILFESQMGMSILVQSNQNIQEHLLG